MHGFGVQGWRVLAFVTVGLEAFGLEGSGFIRVFWS